MRIAVVTLFPLDASRCVGARRLGAGARAGRGRGRVFRSARLHHRCAPHGGRSSVRRRTRHGAQGRAVARPRCGPRGRRSRRAAGACIWARTGSRFEQSRAREARDWPGLILVAGRYEGVDERFIECEIDEQWSIGDYVLTGGELPALVVIDAIVRLLPGTLGSAESAVQESFTDGLVDWPHYTRPAVVGRARGARGVGIRRSCGDPALALAAGAGPDVAAPAGAARAARYERVRSGRCWRNSSARAASNGESGH